jgi:hypothetical protein
MVGGNAKFFEDGRAIAERLERQRRLCMKKRQIRA